MDDDLSIAEGGDLRPTLAESDDEVVPPGTDDNFVPLGLDDDTDNPGLDNLLHGIPG